MNLGIAATKTLAELEFWGFHFLYSAQNKYKRT
jgi:hypothetical protein